MGKEQGIYPKKLTNAFALLAQNERGREILMSQGGIHALCKHCQQYNRCDKQDKPRILKICTKVMQYYLHKERPYKGNIDQQPTFFVEMINALTEKEVEVRNFKRGKNGR